MGRVSQQINQETDVQWGWRMQSCGLEEGQEERGTGVFIYETGEVKIDQAGKKKEKKKGFKSPNLYYGWHRSRSFTYDFASKSCRNAMKSVALSLLCR